jgi:hypothetical protein
MNTRCENLGGGLTTEFFVGWSRDYASLLHSVLLYERVNLPDDTNVTRSQFSVH